MSKISCLFSNNKYTMKIRQDIIDIQYHKNLKLTLEIDFLCDSGRLFFHF